LATGLSPDPQEKLTAFPRPLSWIKEKECEGEGRRTVVREESGKK